MDLLAKDAIRVFATATIANVGCGFDIFGAALNTPGDMVELRSVQEPGVRILEIAGDEGRLPLEADRNTAGKSLQAMLAYLKADFGIEMKLEKCMPVGSGLGSSAASSVASVYALNRMLRELLPVEKILEFAIEGERIASGGNVHLDNISACLYGGFILVRQKEPPDIVRIPVPEDLHFVVLHPRIEVKTAETRRMIRTHIALPQAVTQWANIAGVVTALYEKDYDLLRRSMTDVIIEPVRSILIPHYHELRERAMAQHAYGFGISGSGPSVFAVTRSMKEGHEIGNALSDFLTEKKIENDVYVSSVNTEGPRVVE